MDVVVKRGYVIGEFLCVMIIFRYVKALIINVKFDFIKVKLTSLIDII